MSKKTNTILFILGATVFNVLTTILGFIVLLLIFTQVVNMTGIDAEAASSWGVPLIFVGAIVASFFIYRITLKQITKKVDMEKHFDPLFGPRRRPPSKPAEAYFNRALVCFNKGEYQKAIAVCDEAIKLGYSDEKVNSIKSQAIKANSYRPVKEKKAFDNGDVYEGDVVDNVPHGKGKMTWANGESYEGDWVKGKIHGKGKYTFVDSKIQEGDWEDGEFVRMFDGMEQGFIDVLRQLTKEHGNEALTDAKKCKALLSDYTKNRYSKERRLLLQAVEAGIAKTISDAGDLVSCKKAMIRDLEKENGLSSTAASDIVNTLIFVLRKAQV